MARKKSDGGGGRPRPMKGFRPGKEPPQLKKRRAKSRLPDDASWAQRQMVEAVAGRSPDEVRRMVRKWSLGLVAGGVLLAVLGVFVYSWSVVAGAVVHVLAAVLLFLAYRIRKQGPAFVQMAESFY